MKITHKKLEKYLKDNDLVGIKISNVLSDYIRGYNNLGEICHYYGYSIDKAMGHICELEGRQYLPGIGYVD